MKRRVAPTKPEGVHLLGRSEASYPSKPDVKTLETFPNRYSQRNYVIRFDCPDFTSLCPVTGSRISRNQH